MIKRPPSGKHYSLSIEAPITKVINIILAAQENQPSYIVQALDKVFRNNLSLITIVIALNCRVQVVDILKTSGNADLFSPEMDSMRHKDPDPGLDLLGALLAVRQTLICGAVSV